MSEQDRFIIPPHIEIHHHTYHHGDTPQPSEAAGVDMGPTVQRAFNEGRQSGRDALEDEINEFGYKLVRDNDGTLSKIDPIDPETTNHLEDTATDHARDTLLLTSILDRPDGDVLNIMQAVVELPGTLYDRLSKAYREVTETDNGGDTWIHLRDDDDNDNDNDD